MKQVLRSQLAEEQRAILADSRFVLLEPSEFGVPKIIAHGNDPVIVSQAGEPVSYAEPTPEQKQAIQDGIARGLTLEKATRDARVELASDHRYHVTGQVESTKGVLYRIDESVRNANG